MFSFRFRHSQVRPDPVFGPRLKGQQRAKELQKEIEAKVAAKIAGK